MAVKRIRVQLPEVGENAMLRLDGDSPESLPTLSVKIAEARAGRIVFDLVQLSSACAEPAVALSQRRSASLTVSRASGVRVFTGQIQAQPRGRYALALNAPALSLQRRRDYRLPLVRSVQIKRSGSGVSRSTLARLIDLSAGGAQIELFEPLDIGEVVRISAPMGSNGIEEDIDALVLSCDVCLPEPSAARTRRCARLTFEDDSRRVLLPESSRDEIARYLFARQREMLKLRALLASVEGKPKSQPRGLSAFMAKIRGSH